MDVGTVLACRGAKVSDYGGKSLNIDGASSSIELNPTAEQRYKELTAWYKKQT